MGGLPADLESKWKKQHEEDAENAFIRVNEDGQVVAAPSFFKISESETVLAAKKI